MHSQTVRAPENAVAPCTPTLAVPPDLERCREATDRTPAEGASEVFIPGGCASEETDRQLLAAMAAGSRVALQRLHIRYFPRLAQFFRYLTAASGSETTDDLIAETLFEVWRNSATFAKEMPVKISIMRLAYSHGRRRLVQGEQSRADLRPLSARRAPAGWSANRSEVDRDLPEVFATLGVAQRAVVYLVFSGHARQDVLDILGMSTEAVDAHLASSMHILRPRLACDPAPRHQSTDSSALMPPMDDAYEARRKDSLHDRGSCS